MYIVLENALADVDLAEFERVGYFHGGVIAVPTVNVSLTLKGMRASIFDETEDCQNTLTLAFDAPHDEIDAEEMLLEDPFSAGIIYRRENQDFVELKYKHRLGALVLYAYFLIDTKDCSFGYQEERETRTETRTNVDYALLWEEGLVRGVS